MAFVWRRFMLLFLFLCPLQSLCFAGETLDCFPTEHASQFWLSQDYARGNPYIMRAWIFQFYSFKFDNALSSLSLSSAQMMGADEFARRIPESAKAEFSQAKSSIEQASLSLASARESEEQARAESLAASYSMNNLFGQPAILQTGLPSQAAIEPMLKVAAIYAYTADYPALYSETLSESATSFDSINDAGSQVSQKANEEFQTLSLSGAGSSAYLGAAKDAYFFAKSENLTGFCAQTRSRASAILAYFSSSPQMPDFSELDFPGYMYETAGSGNSSISRMLDLYFVLKSANRQMESEYKSAALNAQSGVERLSLELSQLGGEDLGLIGDSPITSAPAGEVMVGLGYSGIYSAYSKASLDLARAKAELEISSSAYKSKSQDYVALAITRASAAGEIAGSAYSSSLAIRADAESAVSSRKQSAAAAIANARQKANSSRSGLDALQSYSAGDTFLSSAEREFSSAQFAPTLGKRFAAYAKSESLADSAAEAFSGAAGKPSSSALQEISSLSSLIKKAKADGLDVEYEEEKLSTYQSLLSSQSGGQLSAAVASGASADYSALLLRLYEEYSYLEAKHTRANHYELEIGSALPGFTCKLSQYASIFPGGKLDPESGAGILKKISSSLDSCMASAEKSTPAALSAIIASNSQAIELFGPDTLGKPNIYSGTISASNPSSLNYSGKVDFSVRTHYPLYLADFTDGISPNDAFPDGGKTALSVTGVSPGQEFSFNFEKRVQIAQKTSTVERCLLATAEQASASRDVAFFLSQALPSLNIEEQAPIGSQSASALYSGSRYSLENSEAGGASILSGNIGAAPSGKGALEISFMVRSPFELELSGRDYESLSGGAKRATLVASVSSSKISCDKASISIFEPFSGVSNLSVSPISSGIRISGASMASYQNGTLISFSLSPLTAGAASQAAISYTIFDSQQALSEALAQAEIQVLTYNRTRDALSLSEAKSLIAANRANDALSILSRMRQEAESLSYSYADFAQFSNEKSSLESELSSAEPVYSSLLAQNSSSAAAMLGSIISQCSMSLSAASAESESGSPQKALTALRKAKAEFFSSLADGAWKYLSQVSKDHAAAQKANAKSPALFSAQQSLSSASQLYSEGKYAESLLAASKASSVLSSLSSEQAEREANETLLADEMRASYSELRQSTDSLLSSYSSQYSSMSAQSKKRLPFTPTQAQSRLSEADKLFESSKKQSLAPSASLLYANTSYEKLSALSRSLESALLSLHDSASSSLTTARAALSEAKAKSSSQNDIAAIEREVSSSEEYFSSGLYADSIASSDRAVKAAAALLASGSGGLDAKAILLSIVSLAFIAGAAYYLMHMGRKKEKKEKKEVPKSEKEKIEWGV